MFSLCLQHQSICLDRLLEIGLLTLLQIHLLLSFDLFILAYFQLGCLSVVFWFDKGSFFIGTSDTIEAHFCFLVTMKMGTNNGRLSNLSHTDCPLFSNLKKEISHSAGANVRFDANVK